MIVDSIPKNTISMTADVVGLHLGELGFRTQRETLDRRDEKTIPAEEILKMEEF